MTNPHSKFVLAGVAALLMIVTACGSPSDEPAVADGFEVVTPDDESPGDNEAPANGGAGNGGSGEVSLTIGDETWEFDNLLCVTGLEANESDVFAFVAYARGEAADGSRIEFLAEIGDNSGQGRLEGDGVVSYINLILFSGADPADGLTAETDLGWDGNTAVVTPDGGTVSGSGDFVQESEFGFGAPTTPGSFTGTCGADSIG
ncbi:MAG: hypothetical protein CVT64_09150 [Actinobacteria bacterium HGW-Actinobacteria-4]|nr:MAG: hypothetical protein CVT64_09150 [Actinobacteria bacterium HGW-Actinobacteria-4]